MKRWLVLIALLPILAAPAAAADKPPTAAPPTSRMTACNGEAGARKLAGDARKEFMAECLKGTAANAQKSAETPGGQGEVMKRCNKDASGRGLKDRKSTRLNSSHLGSSYAVFCLKKKKTPRAG